MTEHVKVASLGFCLVSYNTKRQELTLVSPSDTGDNYHVPAESVTIFGKTNIDTLREFLNSVEVELKLKGANG